MLWLCFFRFWTFSAPIRRGEAFINPSIFLCPINRARSNCHRDNLSQLPFFRDAIQIEKSIQTFRVFDFSVLTLVF